MLSASSIIFTKSAALRLLSSIGCTKVETLRVLPNCIQATYLTAHGRCSTFLSKALFLSHFSEFRQEGAKSVSIKQWGAGSYRGNFEAHSADSSSYYTVRRLLNTWSCSCRDFDQQQTLNLPKPACKHIYAAIGYVSTLEQVISA